MHGYDEIGSFYMQMMSTLMHILKVYRQCLANFKTEREIENILNSKNDPTLCALLQCMYLVGNRNSYSIVTNKCACLSELVHLFSIIEYIL